MRLVSIYAIAIVAFLVSPPPAAAETSGRPREVSGTQGDLTWNAQSMIVGQESTDEIRFGGDPAYLPTRPQKNGLVNLSMGCSGSLMAGGRAILTAAHCVAIGTGAIRVTQGDAFFYGGTEDIPYDPTSRPLVTTLSWSSVFVAPGYTGKIVDHNDLAIIMLDQAAPAFANQYLLSALADPTGVQFNTAGFGRRGTSGATGATINGRYLREGDNRFEFAMGDPRLAGFYTQQPGFSLDLIGDVWISDFDRFGDPAFDSACSFRFRPIGNSVCDTGLAREVSIAPGDSGGPQFVNGKIVSVSSFGQDFRGSGLTKWGSLNGFAPVFRNRSWIESLVPGAFGAVPEPSSWAMMIAGFGLAGASLRRRAIAAAT